MIPPINLKAVDLFSGCGGLTQGLRDAGFSVEAAVELDPLAAETYAANHPAVRLFNEDIRSLSSIDLLNACGLKKGELDLLAGCPPCQGFSRMRLNNKKRRMSDPRNRLIDEVLRLVRDVFPKAIMLENVPNLARYSRFLKFKSELRKLGYKVTDEVLDVADFGVPQRRRRLVLLASREGALNHPQPVSQRTTVRSVIEELPVHVLEKDVLHNLPEKRSERVQQLIRAIPKDGGSRSSLSPELALKCHTKHDGYYDVYGRMSWDDVSPTITGGCINPSKGRFLHPTEDRAISLREAAMLQSFPPEYTFSLRRGKYAAAEMIGNALPPLFSRLQAEVIRDHLTQK
ncbi:DNA cytosine methyltransferase [Marinobacter sp. TBZ242]|jgi:DNA (cytosine-5)-methyltransferase 1|uniref:Cytosine-specific methyltransferase n=1 Tax=Marinobacter azerbaijanicus TaxID=3050455 RepID=A0ABT7IFM6_9GAMM|nr:DNA cytosine methyltransferase [Marinobacter sp. TBZ242]MBL83351.1 DNA (cytosine-5-)-methyltransferase [Marinobacter sp.]MDL0432965.1 DNA cytosine methyltransferase [Marinobacter sp. TBZ242]|tara:strand:+ start:3972 stop:5003 length:1032 start_codon:yes stop_codon:yes gene_type:complete